MSNRVRDEKRLSDEERKVKLVWGLRDVRARILDLARSLPEAAREQVFLGTWSIRDVLAHLAGWDETNLAATKEVLAGMLPSFYAHHNKDWASYNASLVAEYGRDDYDDLLRLVEATHNKLLAFIEDVPAEALWHYRGLKAKGWKVTAGRLLEVERQDEEEHYSQLREQFEDVLRR